MFTVNGYLQLITEVNQTLETGNGHVMSISDPGNNPGLFHWFLSMICAKDYIKDTKTGNGYKLLNRKLEVMKFGERMWGTGQSTSES